MSDTSYRYSVQTSVEHLSLNFDKLENIHYAKVQEEKDPRSRKKDNLSPSKIYHSDSKKYNSDENGFERLESIKKSYNHEINNLKNLLFRQPSYNERPLGSNESLKACQGSVESSLHSLMERLFTIEEVKRSGKPTLKKIESYFEQTMKDIDLSFSHINHITGRENSPKDNIEKIINLCHINSGAFKEIGDVTSSIKKKIVHSFNEMTTYSISYDKEAQSLQLYLNQATAQFEDLMKRLGTINHEESFSITGDSESRKIANIVGELLAQANSVDVEKNKLFLMTKKQIENTYKKMMSHLKDIICKVEKSNYTNEGVGGIAMKEKNLEKDSSLLFNVRTRSTSPGQMYNSQDIFNSSDIRGSPSPVLDLREEMSKSRSKSPSEINSLQTHSRLFKPLNGEEAYSNSHSPERMLQSVKEPSTPIERTRERYSFSSDSVLLASVATLSRIGLNLKLCGRDLMNTMKIAMDSVAKYYRGNDTIMRNLKQNKENFENQLQELLQTVYKINSTQPSHSTPVQVADRQYSPTSANSKGKGLLESINLTTSMKFSKEDIASHNALAQSCLSPLFSGEIVGEGTKTKIKSLSPYRDILPDVSSLKDENKRLVQEYSNIVKVARKLETKAEERKRNLKEVFAILTEKDNELKKLKTQEQVDTHTNYTEVEDTIKAIENKLEDKYAVLQSKLYQKENRVKELEEKVSRLNNRREFTKIRSPTSASPENIRDLSSPVYKELRSQSSVFEKPIVFEKLDLGEQSLKQLERQIKELKKEKKEIEGKYHHMLKEFERSQEHKKKIEASSQEEVKVLNDKIAQLQLYGEDLEKKYTRQLKQVISPTRSPKASSIKGEFSPSNKEDRIMTFEEATESLQKNQNAIAEKIEKILQELEGNKDSYKALGQLEKVDRILSIIQEGNTARTSSSQKGNTKLIGMIEEKLRTKSSNAELDLVKKQNSDLEVSLKSLKAELEEKIQENKDLNALLLLRNHEQKSFESEQQEKDKKNKELVGKYEKLQKEKEKLEEEIEDLCRQLSGIYQKYGLIEKKLTNNIPYLAEAFKTLENKLEGIKKKNENSANINSKIEDLIKEHGTKQGILKQRISELEENDLVLNQKLKELTGKCKENDLKTLLLTERLDESENCKNEKIKEIKQLHKDKQLLETELFKVTEEKGFLERKIQRNLEESNQLKSDAENNQETLKRSYEDRKEKMQREIQEYKTQITELYSEINLLKTEKEQLKKVSNDHNHSTSELQSIINRLEGEVRLHITEQKTLQSNLNSKELEIKKLTEKLKQTEQEEKQKATTILKLSKELETVKLSNNDLSENIKQKELEICGLNQELESIKTLKAEIETELRQTKQNNPMPEMEKIIENVKSDSRNQLNLKNTEIQNLTIKLRQVEDEKKSNYNSFEKDKKSFEEESKKKDQEIQDIKTQLSTRDEKLKAEVNKFEHEKETMKMDFKKNLDTSQAQLEKAQEQSLSLQKALKQRQDEMNEKDVRIKELSSKIQDLENLLESQKLKLGKLGVPKEKTAFSLANSVESIDVQIQEDESKKDEISGPIWDHLKNSQTKRVLEEEMKALQAQLDDLKKEKSLIQNEYNQAVQEKATILNEIGTLKSSIVLKDSELSDLKQSQSQFDLQVSKIRLESDKKISELEKLLQVMKDRSEELAKEPEMLRKELAKSKEENEGLKKGIESFELSPVLQARALSSHATEGELSSPLEPRRSPSNPDNIQKENKRLREERRHLKDENLELRNSVLVFQEQIVHLNETTKIKNQEFLNSLRKSLMEILELETLQGRVTVNLESQKTAQETMHSLKQALQENEEDMLTLVKELEEYDRKKEEMEEFKEKLLKKEVEMNEKIAEANEILKEGRKRIREEVEFLDNNMNERLLKINAEIETLIRDYTIADLPDETDKVKMSPSLLTIEKLIYSNLNILREYVEMAVEIQDNYERLVLENKGKEIPGLSTVRESEEQTEENNDDEEEKKENNVRKDAQQKMKEVSLLKRRNVALDLEINLGKDTPKGLQDPSLPVENEGPPTFQEVDQDDLTLGAKNDNEVQSIEQIKALLDQIKGLQDDNEKLQEEYKQLEHDYNMLKFIRDELKSEIIDKDERIQQLELKTTENLPTFGGKEKDSERTFEKEHLKSIFIKFIQSALKGNAEAATDLLRTLLSLLYISEDSQTQILNDFKQKASKKGVFNRLFK